MVASVANGQGADEHPTFSLAHDRVPQRRRVAGALDPEPGPGRRAVAIGDPGLEELASRGNLTRAGVDEEDAHAGGA